MTFRRGGLLVIGVTLLVVMVIVSTTRSPDRPDSAAPAAIEAPTPAPTPAPSMTLSERGLGPLRAGMTLAEAQAATGNALTRRGTAEDSLACTYLDWRDGPRGVRVMLEQGRIARVDVDSGGPPTSAGSRIGDTEAAVNAKYMGRVTTTPHKYTDGRYLTVAPAEPADTMHALLFETDGSRVVRYRGGRKPMVEWVEGCS